MELSGVQLTLVVNSVSPGGKASWQDGKCSTMYSIIHNTIGTAAQFIHRAMCVSVRGQTADFKQEISSPALKFLF